MKTLVIHPADSTTAFLSEIYKDKNEWTVLNDPNLPHEEVINSIITHDRIIMCGHGSPQGLFGGIYGFLIDEFMVDLLKDKECICIWCNANVFFKQHNLRGFSTGMFISEVVEANYMGVKGKTNEEINKSNYCFSRIVNKYIDDDNCYDNIIKNYNYDDSVVKYNRERMIFS